VRVRASPCRSAKRGGSVPNTRGRGRGLYCWWLIVFGVEESPSGRTTLHVGWSHRSEDARKHADRFIAGELVKMTHSSPDWLKRFFGRELRGQDKQREWRQHTRRKSR